MIRRNELFEEPAAPVAYGVQTASAVSPTRSRPEPDPVRRVLMTRRRGYIFATIDNETMEATENDKAPLSTPITENVDKTKKSRGLRSSLPRSVRAARLDSTGLGHGRHPDRRDYGSLTRPALSSSRSTRSPGNATDAERARRGSRYVNQRQPLGGTITVATSGYEGCRLSVGLDELDYLLVQGNLNATISGLPGVAREPGKSPRRTLLRASTARRTTGASAAATTTPRPSRSRKVLIDAAMLSS